MESIKGKNILVLGATGGIGSQTAKLLAASGANLFLAGRNNGKLADIAANLNIGPEHYFALDISNQDAVNELKVKYFNTLPGIDILINAIGTGIIKPLESLTTEDFLESFNSNLLGPFLLMKAFLPAMKEANNGLIINIPGVLGKSTMAGAAAYSASKYGLVGMMQSFREEVKRTNIRISNIILGGVNSPFWDNIDLRVQKEKMITSEEAAKAIWFLCQQPKSGVVNEMVLQPFNHQVL